MSYAQNIVYIMVLLVFCRNTPAPHTHQDYNISAHSAIEACRDRGCDFAEPLPAYANWHQIRRLCSGQYETRANHTVPQPDAISLHDDEVSLCSLGTLFIEGSPLVLHAANSRTPYAPLARIICQTPQRTTRMHVTRRVT